MNTKLTIFSIDVQEASAEKHDYYKAIIHAKVDGHDILIHTNENYESLPEVILGMQTVVEGLDPQPGTYRFTVHDFFNVVDPD